MDTMATIALSLAEVGLLAGLLLAFKYAGDRISAAILRGVERHLEGTKERPIPQLDSLERWALKLTELEARVNQLPTLWEDYQEKARATEDRIRHRIAKAKRDGIAFEDGALQPRPDDEGDSRELRGVSGEEAEDDAVAQQDLGLMIFAQRASR